VHLAAYAYVGESMRVPEVYFENNLAGTLSLLHAMIDVGVPHIVFSSTCATYGLPVCVPIRRDHVQEPVNPYGESKLAIERVLRWDGAAHELHWTALRYFNAAGVDPDGDIGECHDPETHLIPLAIRTALGLEPWLDVLGTDYPTPDGTAVRDYIHVADLADAHVQALGYLRAGGPSAASNLGTGRGHSVREIAQAVARVSGRQIPVREAARRPGDVPVLVADAGDSATTLQWRAERSDLDEIVASAWRWHARLAAGEPPAARQSALAGSREPDWSRPPEPMVSAPSTADSHG
jgi:UDP-arabinose 4-epimerase